MIREERLVAVILPSSKLSALVKKGFRAESLPAEGKVMVWGDDFQSEQKLTNVLIELGITPFDVRKAAVTVSWQYRQRRRK